MTDITSFCCYFRYRTVVVSNTKDDENFCRFATIHLCIWKCVNMIELSADKQLMCDIEKIIISS